MKWQVLAWTNKKYNKTVFHIFWGYPFPKVCALTEFYFINFCTYQAVEFRTWHHWPCCSLFSWTAKKNTVDKKTTLCDIMFFGIRSKFHSLVPIPAPQSKPIEMKQIKEPLHSVSWKRKNVHFPTLMHLLDEGTTLHCFRWNPLRQKHICKNSNPTRSRKCNQTKQW